MDFEKCPKCQGSYVYEDGDNLICPECFYEANKADFYGKKEEEFIVKDAFGTMLKDGDSVTLIKDLKVKGSSNTIKVGTKVKNIKLVDSDHNIDCKIDGFGAMSLKSEFVKKI